MLLAGLEHDATPPFYPAKTIGGRREGVNAARDRLVGRFRFVHGDGNEEIPLLPKAAVRIPAVKVGLHAIAVVTGLARQDRSVPKADSSVGEAYVRDPT
jgi:hypothetical protein